MEWRVAFSKCVVDVGVGFVVAAPSSLAFDALSRVTFIPVPQPSLHVHCDSLVVYDCTSGKN